MKERYNNFSMSTPVAIPIIQRDYVQGSDTNAEKRDKFIESLLDSLRDESRSSHEIDFIYGSSDSKKQGSHFMPVDGQQRLTTLALLAWILNHKTGYAYDGSLPRLTYLTRPSTEQFCHHLFGYRITSDYRTVSDHIKTVPGWFSDRWLDDPSVKAMLDFLDKTDAMLSQPPYSESLDVIARRFFTSSPITFEVLDMQALNLNDDLYIKMNARGKLLTAFENWKAGFEGMLADKFSDIAYEHKMIPETDRHATLAEYFEYAVEHDWCDLMWPIARDRWEKISDSDGMKASYPRVDEFFMNLVDFISRFMFYSSIGDVDKEAKEKKTDVRGLYDRRKDESRDSVYQSAGNIIRLFRMLDTLVEISTTGGIKNYFDSLFVIGFDRNKSQVNLYNSPSTNLFELCLDDRLETSTEALLWAVLNYLLCHPGCIKTPDRDMLDYLTVIVGWIRGRRQRLTKGLAVNANIRQSDFREADSIIRLLAGATDMFAALKATANSSLEGEREKARYHATPKEKAVRILSNIPELYSCFNLLYDSLDATNDVDAYIDRLTEFMRLGDTSKIKTLNSHGFTGIETMFNHYFYGLSGKWDYIFTATPSERGFRNAVKAVTAYMAGDKPLNFGKLDLPYYIGRYDEFINACNSAGGARHYLIGQNISPFRLWSVKTLSTQPIRGYNVDPYGFTVSKRYSGPLKLWAESDNSTHGVLYVNDDSLVLECVDSGWQINSLDFESGLAAAILKRFTATGQPDKTVFADSEGEFSFDGAIILDLPECDRIETALKFLKAVE